MHNVHIHASLDDLSARLIEHVMKILLEKWRLAASHQSSFQLTLGISGGSLPKFLGEGFQKFTASEAMKSSLSYSELKSMWAHTIIVLCDERYVTHDHPDRNQLGIETDFLSHLQDYFDVKIRLLSMNYTTDRSVEDAAVEYENQLRCLYPIQDYPSLDLLLLGMGPDGHTCSLFPHHPSFQLDTPVWVYAVRQSPKPPGERITLTLPVLQHAFIRIIVVTGESKAAVVRDILQATSDQRKYPAGCLPSAQTYWYLDSSAASLL
jgi:6-phosphogluconolactonase